MRRDRRGDGKDPRAVRQQVGDERLPDRITVTHPLVIHANAERYRQTIVRRPAILRVPAVVQVEVRADRPVRAIGGRIAGVDEADAIGRAARIRAGIRVADGPRLAVVAVAVRIVQRLEPELEIVAAALLGQVIGELRLHLRLLAKCRERDPPRSVDGGRGPEHFWRPRRGIHLHDHRPVQREIANVDIEERPVGDDALPLTFVHARHAVLRADRLGRQERREAPLRLLFPSLLEVADERVVLARLRRHLGRFVVEDAEIGCNRLGDARHGLVDLEVVVRAVEPDLVPGDRAAQIGVPLPEQQVRVVALRRAEAVVRTREPASRDVRRRGIAAHEAARFVRQVLEPSELVPAALDRGHDRGAAGVHLDVAAERPDRHFFVGKVVLVEAGAPDAFGVVHSVGHDARLILNAEDLVARLLALVAAADVEAQHLHAGRFRQRRPHVGGIGYGDQRIALQARADFRRGDVDDRRIRRDGDVLGEAADLHLRIERDRLAEDDDDVVAVNLPEALQLERQLVRA